MSGLIGVAAITCVLHTILTASEPRRPEHGPARHAMRGLAVPGRRIRTRDTAARPLESAGWITGWRRIEERRVRRDVPSAASLADVLKGETAVTLNDPKGDVTRLLEDFDQHDDAAAELLPLVYDQLRAIAQRRMSGERADHTLQATVLVHEAFMKLVGDHDISWEGRRHFYAVAARAMRRVLIDHARKRLSEKRGGGRHALPMEMIDLAASQDPQEIIALDDALTRLEEEEPRAAQIVQLRYYAGLSVEETAEAVGVSERTVMREWSFARARLYQLLHPEEP
jgi:RNA polymerase sigma-70 factor (ECF subfamily)